MKTRTGTLLYNEKINLPESIQIGRIPQSWSCERENTESGIDLNVFKLVRMFQTGENVSNR